MQEVDFVAASFVQSAADVQMIRQTLGEKGDFSGHDLQVFEDGAPFTPENLPVGHA